MGTGTEPRVAGRQAFDRLFASGCEALRAGRPVTQTPPVEKGARWGLSALLRPGAEAAAALDLVAKEAAAAAGIGQWVTGAAVCSHLTIRGLEHWRSGIGAGDPLVRRYAAALTTAAEGIGPLTFEVAGLTLTPSSVLAHALPSDGATGRLASAFAAALGADGWLEHDFPRDFWYLTLVHFAGAVEHPDRLVAWVAEHRDRAITTMKVEEVELSHFRFTGRGMLPVPVTTVPLR
jgi:hypothetical protein